MDKAAVGPMNQISSLAAIGGPPQHRQWFSGGEEGKIEIGSGNTIREFVVVHKPFSTGRTRIGNNNYIMAHCTINHDCAVGNGCTLASNVTLAGNVTVQHGANVGQGASVHQRVVLGAYCMIGMNAAVVKHVPPFVLFNPGGKHRVNRIGMERSGFTQDDILEVEDYYRSGGGKKKEFTSPRLAMIFADFFAAADKHPDRKLLI